MVLFVFTSNIYGDVELVGNVNSIKQPFVEPQLNAPSPLLMSESLRDRLEFRGAAMQIGRRFDSDTLCECFLKEKIHSLVQSGSPIFSMIIPDFP